MTPFTPAAAPDFLALTYRPDLHLLVSRWRRPVSGAEFRVGYRAILALAVAVGCPYWQVDLRGCNAAEAEAQQWLTDKFLPHLPGALATPVYLGYLLSPQLLRQLPGAAGEAAPSSPGAQPSPDAPPPAGHRAAFFADEGALTTWLSQCQHRGPAALAQAGFTRPLAA